MKRTIRDNINPPYTLHDMNVISFEVTDNDIIMRTQSGIVETTFPYRQIDGYVEFHHVQWDFSYVYLLGVTGNVGTFTGEKMFLKDFIDRYLRGKYSKINQGNVRAYGKDLWDGRFWNSVAWGAPKSQIGTKLYNKTLELKEAHDKPYIRQAWAAAGLVDDFIQLTKRGADGTYYKPDIWRVEFSIQSSVKGWYCIEHDNLGNPKKHSFRNDLSRYATKADMLNVFASLADHYFHFKHFEVGQRKDRCKDKVLFDFTNEEPVFYSIEKVATAKPENKDALILLRRLMAYKVTHYDKEVNKAVDLLIDTLQEERLRKCAVQPHDETEVELLRKLISIRMQTNALNDLTIDMETAKAMVTIEKDIWNNND